MSGAHLTEHVKHTREKLRKQTLTAVFEEFDGKLMGLDRRKRAVKYRKMAESPFSFFRGSAYLFYFDVSRDYLPYHTDPSRPTWIQGDLHMENFGAFRTESGELVYDVNDFDEGYLGSYLYDLLRMSVSIALVGRTKEQDRRAQYEAIVSYLEAYAKQMRRFARQKEDPQTFVVNETTADGPVRKLLRKLRKRKDEHLLEKVTALMQGGRQFAQSEEIVQPGPEEEAALLAAWPHYIEQVASHTGQPEDHYKVKDIAVKHGSGTASLGLDRYYVLIEAGIGEEGKDDIVLEVKEVRTPIPAYFMPYEESFWQSFDYHQGRRVVMTQQAMHHEADRYLGELSIGERQFYVRERSPYKKRLKLAALAPEEMGAVLATMGQLTAKLHARADADVEQGLLAYHSEAEIVQAMGEDEAAFFATITHWALAYADQVERDFALFTQWAASRRKA
ncbi:uncharacterized protein (DUF2252 family) [Paenibacillus phyllosphaerae]|uniref:Uncharacterized protein (DUF2252 family) n=1 Tax=Paenibacillus phyllosphaerae TaxID=274593 RepID=A0A7W5FN00_9BACL|nr:DUF2252 family protein [Paenibacillus phyllosphaerae]MBB3110668.1 uncharacterized protein (DUF2252 family) [Paenibacillus phyllosphaerae]